MQKVQKICITNANWEKKTRQIDAKNRNLHCQCKDFKNLHCQLKNEKHLSCQCKEYKKFAPPTQKLKNLTCNAKNIKNWHCQCQLGKENSLNRCKKLKKTCIANAKI